jgi:hypothetical protein
MTARQCGHGAAHYPSCQLCRDESIQNSFRVSQVDSANSRWHSSCKSCTKQQVTAVPAGSQRPAVSTTLVTLACSLPSVMALQYSRLRLLAVTPHCTHQLPQRHCDWVTPASATQVHSSCLARSLGRVHHLMTRVTSLKGTVVCGSVGREA